MAGSFKYTVSQEIPQEEEVPSRYSDLANTLHDGVANEAMDHSTTSLNLAGKTEAPPPPPPPPTAPPSESMKTMVSFTMNDPRAYNDISSKGQERYTWSIYRSVLYGVILVLFGMVFATTEALRGEWMQFEIASAFTVYMHVVAIIFLIYVQINMCITQRKEKQEEAHEMSGKEHSLNRSQTGTPPDVSSGDDLHLRHRKAAVSPAEVTYDKYGVRSDRHFVTEFDENEMTNEVRLKAHFSRMTTATLSSEGTSVYLRMGFLVFAVGNLILLILEIKTYIEQNQAGCVHHALYTKYCHLAFLLVQTFFILRNTQLHVRGQQALIRFGIMHVLANNLTVWVRTLVEEVKNEYEHLQGTGEEVEPSNTNTEAPHSLRRLLSVYEGNSSDPCSSDLLLSLQPYLFPFILEYSLIAVAVCAGMFQSLEINLPYKIFFTIQRSFASVAGRWDYDRDTGEQGSCFTKSNNGLFAGILVLTSTIVAIILFFFYMELDEEQFIASRITSITNIIIHFLLLIAVFLAITYIRHFRFTRMRDNSIDDILLITALGGLLVLGLFEIITSVTALRGRLGELTTEDKTQHGLLTAMFILEMIQALFQTVYILDGLQRFPRDRDHQRHKPGRNVISFLIIGNVTLWVLKSLVVKRVSLEATLEMFGTVAGPLIININLPLVLFYRFHSSICLADMWISVYEPIFDGQVD